MMVAKGSLTLEMWWLRCEEHVLVALTVKVKVASTTSVVENTTQRTYLLRNTDFHLFMYFKKINTILPNLVNFNAFPADL